MAAPQIVWFRRDLRLGDQAAVMLAASSGPVLPVYVLDDDTPKHRRMGGASRWWLYHSLKSLANRLDALGSRLILRRGAAVDIIAEIARESGASAIHCLRHYEPWWRNAEKDLQKALGDIAELHRHDGNYLVPPGSVRSGNGAPYKIYTPFWKALREYMPPPQAAPAPQRLVAPAEWPESDDLNDWSLLPISPNWAIGMEEEWTPGETGVRRRIDDFVRVAARYHEGRNLPSQDLVSRLSPHLHFGEISPARIWHGVAGQGSDVTTYLKELVWRDYAQNVILQFPDYGSRNARSQFDKFPWRDFDDPDVQSDFKRWTSGQTGYPIVDAGMRELWATGWMHNRVRMIAASFLIKHLLIDWRQGEQWFWDTLCDADYASNAVNWQWVAGTGVDSNMFVRIMAPLSQSEKFDAGGYIRKWVPELADLDDPYIHDPEEYGCLPADYPAKIIGHREARQRALDAYAQIK